MLHIFLTSANHTFSRVNWHIFLCKAYVFKDTMCIVNKNNFFLTPEIRIIVYIIY